MLLIVSQLFFAAAVGFINGLLHAFGNAVGIHDDFSVDVTGSASGRLCQ